MTKPTIEERMLDLQSEVFRLGVRNPPVVQCDVAASVARRYAAERTAPLVAALHSLCEKAVDGGVITPQIKAGLAALAAEEEARRG